MSIWPTRDTWAGGADCAASLLAPAGPALRALTVEQRQRRRSANRSRFAVPARRIQRERERRRSYTTNLTLAADAWFPPPATHYILIVELYILSAWSSSIDCIILPIWEHCAHATLRGVVAVMFSRKFFSLRVEGILFHERAPNSVKHPHFMII